MCEIQWAIPHYIDRSWSMPDNMKAVLYARVSSDRQEQEDTVQSQLGELRAALEDAGVSDWQEFIDEGYARDNLVRPALDRLRDLAAQRDVSKVYVQSPDRLASGARLVILAEEFQEQGVDVVFLKGSVESTPEGKLLLHMQGAIAEYERTKISERTRRGKLYWARQGAMVGGHAPYGYRFIRRIDIHRARLEISETQASVVREMYRLVLEERLSTRGLARHLEARGIPTPRGANQWSPTTIDRILRNPVYRGTFFYQRTESALPSKRLSADPYKQSRKTGSKPRPQGDWIAIPVPVIVDEPVWNAVQGQLRQNSLHSPRNNKRHGYLLRGLVRCPRCGGAYTGYSQKGNRGYRCQRRDPTVSSTGQRCKPGAVSAQRLEDAVWDAISESLQQPQLLADEYRRRLSENAGAQPFAEERKKLGKSDPGPPSKGTGNFLWVAEDPDAAWKVIAPHALHETNAYGEWMAEAGLGDENTTYKIFDDASALRAAGDYAVVTPDELIETARKMGPMDSVLLHPLIGGIDPDFSWECLRLVEQKVLPALG